MKISVTVAARWCLKQCRFAWRTVSFLREVRRCKISGSINVDARSGRLQLARGRMFITQRTVSFLREVRRCKISGSINVDARSGRLQLARGRMFITQCHREMVRYENSCHHRTIMSKNSDALRCRTVSYFPSSTRQEVSNAGLKNDGMKIRVIIARLCPKTVTLCAVERCHISPAARGRKFRTLA